jgi:hypothetical protein
VQHFADCIFAERGVRLGRVAMIQPRLNEAPPEGILNARDDSGSMSVAGQKATSTGDWTGSALAPRADIGSGRHHVGFGTKKTDNIRLTVEVFQPDSWARRMATRHM